MLIATVGQGCLPTNYCCGNGAGIFGVIALLVLRILQGFSAGGELSTAAVWIAETVPPERLGVSLSWISVFGAFGSFAIASFFVSIVEWILTPEQMLLWGWRVPFLFSIIPGTIFIVFRSSLEETEEFDKQSQATPPCSDGDAAKDTASPWFTLISNHRIPMFVSTLAGAGVGAFWYVVPIYGVSFLQNYAGVPETTATLASSIGFVCTAVLCPPVGWLIDHVGVGKVFFLSAVICLVTPIPLFFWWAHTPESLGIFSVYFSMVVVVVLQAFTSSIYLWFVELFPTRCRGVGVSFAYNLGVGIFGGLGPLISDAGNLSLDPTGPVSSPAIYVTAVSLMSFLVVLASRWMGHRGTLQLTHMRATPY